MSDRILNPGIQSLHHIAIICSDYEKSKRFYTEILGFQVKNEVYREERQSFKLDLSLNGHYLIELFSFPNPPNRLSRPESTGLRHIAFGVNNIEESCLFLKDNPPVYLWFVYQFLVSLMYNFSSFAARCPQ